MDVGEHQQIQQPSTLVGGTFNNLKVPFAAVKIL
jgi:hypothetical protein